MDLLNPKIKLDNVKHVVIVASGKGGVGKSTVSVNLAISLARQGLKVALVDADLYGPSIPKMMGVEDIQPEVTMIGDKGELPIAMALANVVSPQYMVRCSIDELIDLFRSLFSHCIDFRKN